MQKLHAGEEVYAQNENILEELRINERTLRRYLEDIHTLYSHILVVEKKQKKVDGRKVSIYRVFDKEEDVAEVLRFFLEESNELGWILSLIHEKDPSMILKLNDEEKESIEESMCDEDDDIFVFRTNPFETLQDKKHVKIYEQLKLAVKNHEYRNIVYLRHKEEVFKNAKCLKLIFVNSNWYIAIETDESKLRLLRITFIKSVTYASKATYHAYILARYENYFDNMQNALSLYGMPQKRAILRASPFITRYFNEGMKPFFHSQKFIETTQDGSVIFSIT